MYHYPAVPSHAATVLVGQVVNLRPIVNRPGERSSPGGLRNPAQSACGLPQCGATRQPAADPKWVPRQPAWAAIVRGRPSGLPLRRLRPPLVTSLRRRAAQRQADWVGFARPLGELRSPGGLPTRRGLTTCPTNPVPFGNGGPAVLCDLHKNFRKQRTYGPYFVQIAQNGPISNSPPRKIPALAAALSSPPPPAPSESPDRAALPPGRRAPRHTPG